MSPAALLKLLTAGREWSVVRFSNYPGWDWVHELGPETRECMGPDGDWVIFVDGALLYYVNGTEGSEPSIFRLECM